MNDLLRRAYAFVARVAEAPERARIERLRRSILNSTPVRDLNDRSAEIHVLTSEADWLNLVWSLKSFYRVSDRPLALCIHCDPTVTGNSLGHLTSHFPEARIIECNTAAQELSSALAAYPMCLRFRQANTLSIKVFDFFHYLRAPRLALFDSDLLFFRRPDAWLHYLHSAEKKNVFNPDVATAYALPFADLERHEPKLIGEVNSGFGVVHPESMQLEWIEEFLHIPGLINGHFWRIEQTLFALCSSRFGVDLLPEDYRVYFDEPLGDRPFRHYVGRIRNLMYTQGMRTLAPALVGGHVRGR